MGKEIQLLTCIATPDVLKSPIKEIAIETNIF
jgi:hypothetical protein